MGSGHARIATPLALQPPSLSGTRHIGTTEVTAIPMQLLDTLQTLDIPEYLHAKYRNATYDDIETDVSALYNGMPRSEDCGEMDASLWWIMNRQKLVSKCLKQIFDR